MRNLCERLFFIKYNVLKANLCATAVPLLKIHLDCFPLYFSNVYQFWKLLFLSSVKWFSLACVPFRPINSGTCSFEANQPIGRISKLAHATPMRNLCETHEKTLRGHDERAAEGLQDHYTLLTPPHYLAEAANAPKVKGSIPKLSGVSWWPRRHAYQNNFWCSAT